MYYRTVLERMYVLNRITTEVSQRSSEKKAEKRRTLTGRRDLLLCVVSIKAEEADAQGQQLVYGWTPL